MPVPSPGTRITLNIISFHKAVISVLPSIVISSPTAFSLPLTSQALNSLFSGASNVHLGNSYVEPLAISTASIEPLPSPGLKLTLYFTSPLFTLNVYSVLLVPSSEITVILKVFSPSFNKSFSVSYPLNFLSKTIALLFNVANILCILSPNWKYK